MSHGFMQFRNFLRPLRNSSFRKSSLHLGYGNQINCTSSIWSTQRRCLSSMSEDEKGLLNSEREGMDYDVVIVGAGPAGLSAAIRLKQLAQEQDTDISVCVVEKGAEVGSHILSGNIFQPGALDDLIPDWKEKGAPINTKVVKDQLYFFTKQYALPLPVPPDMHNEGNYIISLGSLCRWLGEEAENLEVEIYPGFSASEVLYTEDNAVRGVATADLGIGKDGKPKDVYERGMELRAKQVIFSEGARGSLSQEVMERYNLRENCDPQTYGIGIKEVWELDPEKFQSGSVMHSIGWPADWQTWMGAFVYHMDPNLLLIGTVTGLDYKNPYLNPYKEFQRFKHHPKIKQLLEGGKCISYGARALNEGGFQAIPKLCFPGGVLTGCSAGFLNVPKIKGTKNAMRSGMLAAETIFEELSTGQKQDEVEDPWACLEGATLNKYETNIQESEIWKDMYSVRNVHPSFKYSLPFFMGYSGLEAFVLKGRTPWTFKNTKSDAAKTGKASDYKKIDYPKPDGKISFDLLSNLTRSGTYHEEDQPSHLVVKDGMDPLKMSFEEHAGPESRFCPAGVYEWLTDEDGSNPKLQINAQNCLHCKTCGIKTPQEYISWEVPEGGGGPAYENM